MPLLWVRPARPRRLCSACLVSGASWLLQAVYGGRLGYGTEAEPSDLIADLRTLVPVVEAPDWKGAACAGTHDTVDWFPGEFGKRETRLAKAAQLAADYCDHCPIKQACYEFGHTSGEFGVWGGVLQEGKWKRPVPPGPEPSTVHGVYWHSTRLKWEVKVQRPEGRRYGGCFTDQAAAEACARELAG